MTNRHNRNPEHRTEQSPAHVSGAERRGDLDTYIHEADAEAQEKMQELQGIMNTRGSTGSLEAAIEDPNLRFMARALFEPSARFPLASLRKHIQKEMKDKLRFSELQGMGDYFPPQSGPFMHTEGPKKEVDEEMKSSRLGLLRYRMYKDLFIPRPGRAAHGRPWDLPEADYAGEIVASIIGVNEEEFKLGLPDFSSETDQYKVDPSKKQPLTEEEVDQIVELMPALIQNSEYKLALWGNWRGLANTAFLFSLIGNWYPEKIKDIDIRDTVARTRLLLAVAQSDANQPRYGAVPREEAARFMPGLEKSLKTLTVARATQMQYQDGITE